MTESWYLAVGGDAHGPFDMAAMAAKVADGSLSADAQVCRAGEQAWRQAGSDPSLAPLFGSAPGWSFSLGWKAAFRGFRRSWGPLVLVLLLVIAVSAPGFVLSQSLSAGLQFAKEPGAVMALGLASMLVGVVNWVFVGIPIQQAGLTYAVSKAASGTMQVSDLFQGYRRLGMVLATGVVLALCIGLVVVLACGPGVAMIVVGAAMGNAGSAAGLPLIIGGATLLFTLLLLALWFAFPYLYAPVVACDPAFGRPGFAECFRLSAQGIRGRVSSVAGFLLVMALLAAMSILLFCVGYLLVGMPLLLAAQGAVYDLCVRSRASRPQAG